MVLKFFMTPLAPQNLPFIALGYALPTYLSKTKVDLISLLPTFAAQTEYYKPLYSLGIGLELYSMVDLTGQFGKASTKSDRFILLCTVFVAADCAYEYFTKLLPPAEETENLPSTPLPLHTRNFILITKTFAMAVQITFHPFITVAGVVTGFALSCIDISTVIKNIDDENVQTQLSQTWEWVQPYLARSQETQKTVVVWNEWRTVTSSVANGSGAFMAGLNQGRDLAVLFGKTPPLSPK